MSHGDLLALEIMFSTVILSPWLIMGNNNKFIGVADMSILLT